MESYTKEYYSQINKDEKEQAKVLSDMIVKLYRPNSIVDIGCGTGLYLAPFKCIRYGFDISPDAFDPEVIQVERGLVDIRDLTDSEAQKSFHLMSDVAICLEVLEHIGSEFADTIVNNISKWSNTLVVTASPPGQAGLNHVNCQPQKYWDEKFEALGYHRDYHDEYQIISELDKVHHTTWIIRNLMVYKKNE